LIGTVKFTNVDSTNRYHLSKGIEMLKDARRGSWVLVQAFNKHPQFEKLQRDHAAQQRRLQPAQRKPFVPPFDHVAENSGFISLKDSKVVVFYSNDLKGTLPERVMDSSDSRAVEIVHGLATIYRWTGTEVLHRSAFSVPAPIVAYNSFMNAVDRMDQVRSTLRTQRREKRIHMSIWTYLLDLSVSQAYAVYQKMTEANRTKQTFFEFKRNICEQLIIPHRITKSPARSRRERAQAAVQEEGAQGTTRKRNRSNQSNLTDDECVGVIDTDHMLLENYPRAKVRGKPKPADVDCYLCKQMGKELRTIYSCSACRRGFHVNCFTAYHNRWALPNCHSALLAVLLKSEKKPTLGHNCKYSPTSLDDLKLPALKPSTS